MTIYTFLRNKLKQQINKYSCTRGAQTDRYVVAASAFIPSPQTSPGLTHVFSDRRCSFVCFPDVRPEATPVPSIGSPPQPLSSYGSRIVSHVADHSAVRAIYKTRRTATAIVVLVAQAKDED